MTAPAVRFAGVTKRFPGVVALADVSFDVQAGSCHAVCGENGAGKSTLGKLLAGIHVPDEGEILLDGRAVRFTEPRDALAAGVAIVHQELAFCENLSVAENLCLGRIPRRWGFVDRPALHEQARRQLAEVGATIDPARAMASLSIAEQQVVQIAAAVGAQARVIVFDEPTSSLGAEESEQLFALIGTLRARGAAILYVSHRMPEIYRLCDTITVLRDGRHVVTSPASALDEAALVRHMIGRSLEQYYPEHVNVARGAERLRVERLTRPGVFEDISFSVHAGEVVGLAGLVGAGRSEVAEAIFGTAPAVRGTVYVDGRPVRIGRAKDAVALGIGFVPEDRKKQGLVLGMRTRENTSLPTLERVSHLGWVDADAERRLVGEYFDRLRVKATQETVTAALSGGNQQKLVMAKWLAAAGDILILDEPTRGVDVGAKAEIHAWVDRLASEGRAILLISSDLPELLSLATRVVVLRGGHVVGELGRTEMTQESVLRLMAGVGANRPGASRLTS